MYLYSPYMGVPSPGGEKSGGKEDTLSVLQEFFVWVLAIQPEEVPKIEFQRVHRVGKTNEDGKPRSKNSEISALSR